jgi:hypothetical protein
VASGDDPGPEVEPDTVVASVRSERIAQTPDRTQRDRLSGRPGVPMTAPGTPVAARAFAISSEPREDQPRPVPHDSAGGAESHPERAVRRVEEW